MDLVDDDDLARQTEVAQDDVLGLESGEQRLVDGADDVIGQDRAFSAEEPLVDDRRGFAL